MQQIEQTKQLKQMNQMKQILAVGLAAGVLSSGVMGYTTQAQAQENCQKYAFLALKQARDNERRKCGNTGPRWSVDLKAHESWCVSVAPQQWKAELRQRAEMLEKCK